MAGMMDHIAQQDHPALYPPTVTPPAQPLPLRRFLLTFVRNPLCAVPVQVYHEPFLTCESRPGTAVTWVTAPDLTERILVSEVDNFSKTHLERRVLGPALGRGVLTSSGQLWRWQRHAMAPLFRHREILSYVPDMSAAGNDQLARWRVSGGPRVQAIENAMVDTTFSIIARTMLGGGEPAEAEAIKLASAAFLSRISWEMAFAMLRLPEWFPHPGTYRIWRSSRTLRTAVTKIVQRRRTSPEHRTDLLGRLLAARDPESGEPMSDELMVDNLLTLLEAGHETTAKALTWTLYLLARSPAWQDRIRDEVRSVAGNAPLDATHVDKLSETAQVLKEAMRLYPPAPVIMRTPLKTARFNGTDIPAGSLVVVPIFALHRHRALWDDPDRFAPERFTAAFEEALPRTQYMPFGAGPRICLGMSFAMVEAKILLATFIRGARFSWDGRHLPEPVSRITLCPRGGMPLIVELL